MVVGLVVGAAVLEASVVGLVVEQTPNVVFSDPPNEPPVLNISPSKLIM